MSYIRSRKHAVVRSEASLTATAATAALAALLALPAHAEEAAPSKRLKDIVVSADAERVAQDRSYKADISASPKATATLLDTPQTVTVIKEQLFREQVATTLTEALQNSPGVGTFYLGENGNTTTGDAVFMRGADVSSSIFVDGVRDTGSIARDVFNIEQVEVLKGAAGADVGRGAATGAISLVSKQPKLADSRAGSISYGSGDFKRAVADVNMGLTDSIAARLNLMIQDSDVVGRDRVENNRWGVAPSIAFGLNGDTRVFLDYLHVQQNNVPDGGVPTVGLPGYSSPDPIARPFLSNAARVDSENFYGTTNDHDDSNTDMVTGIVEHDFGSGFTVRNITRWGETDQNYRLMSFMAGATQLQTPAPDDPDSWTITRNANNKNVTNKILTNQTTLRASFATGFVQHTIATGVEFIREEQKTRTYAAIGTLPPVSLYHPDPNAPEYATVLTGAYTKGKTDTAAIYFNDTLVFSPQWQISAGLRLDHYDTKYTAVTADGVATTIKSNDDLVSGKVGLVFKPQENGSFYASYAVTRQPPGGANFSLSAADSANANNPQVEPQTAKTYEVGTKWDLLANRLAVTGAIYRTEFSDQVLEDSDGTFYRAGEKRVQGVEITATGQINENWAVNAGYTIMDTKVESPTGQVVVADGSRDLAYNPKDAFTLWTTYRVTDAFTLGGGARYVGKLKRGSDRSVGTPEYADSYWLLNAMATYQVTDDFNLQLNVYNLTDENYVASINKSGYRYNPGIPRSARITANFSF
jgi:catecholate siderophore receptor